MYLRVYCGVILAGCITILDLVVAMIVVWGLVAAIVVRRVVAETEGDLLVLSPRLSLMHAFINLSPVSHLRCVTTLVSNVQSSCVCQKRTYDNGVQFDSSGRREGETHS